VLIIQDTRGRSTSYSMPLSQAVGEETDVILNLLLLTYRRSGALSLSNSPEPQQSAGTESTDRLGRRVYSSAVSAQKEAGRPFPLCDNHASVGSRDPGCLRARSIICCS